MKTIAAIILALFFIILCGSTGHPFTMNEGLIFYFAVLAAVGSNVK